MTCLGRSPLIAVSAAHSGFWLALQETLSSLFHIADREIAVAVVRL